MTVLPPLNLRETSSGGMEVMSRSPTLQMSGPGEGRGSGVGLGLGCCFFMQPPGQAHLRKGNGALAGGSGGGGVPKFAVRPKRSRSELQEFENAPPPKKMPFFSPFGSLGCSWRGPFVLEPI